MRLRLAHRAWSEKADEMSRLYSLAGLGSAYVTPVNPRTPAIDELRRVEHVGSPIQRPAAAARVVTPEEMAEVEGVPVWSDGIRVG